MASWPHLPSLARICWEIQYDSGWQVLIFAWWLVTFAAFFWLPHFPEDVWNPSCSWHFMAWIWMCSLLSQWMIIGLVNWQMNSFCYKSFSEGYLDVSSIYVYIYMYTIDIWIAPSKSWGPTFCSCFIIPCLLDTPFKHIPKISAFFPEIMQQPSNTANILGQ